MQNTYTIFLTFRMKSFQFAHIWCTYTGKILEKMLRFEIWDSRLSLFKITYAVFPTEIEIANVRKITFDIRNKHVSVSHRNILFYFMLFICSLRKLECILATADFECMHVDLGCWNVSTIFHFHLAHHIFMKESINTFVLTLCKCQNVIQSNWYCSTS